METDEPLEFGYGPGAPRGDNLPAEPDHVAMLVASDLGQPVYRRMGYLTLSRFTLWSGHRRN